MSQRRRAIPKVQFVLLALIALSALGAALAKGISAGVDQSIADEACVQAEKAAADYGAIASVRRAELDDLNAIADWQEARLAADILFRSPLRDLPVSSKWTVCVYNGSFVTPVAPRADGTIPDPHNTLTVLVTDKGDLILDSAGYAGAAKNETPRDAAR